ncbi:MAG: GtrA family protein [Pseudomonadota bacterium]
MPELRTEMVRFAIAGVAGLLVDIAVLYGAQALGTGWYLGRVLSFLAAVYVTWRINRRYTFQSRAAGSTWQEWWRYLSAMAGGGAVNYAAYSAVLLALPAARWVPLFAVAAGSVAGMGVNFLSARYFVFKR